MHGGQGANEIRSEAEQEFEPERKHHEITEQGPSQEKKRSDRNDRAQYAPLFAVEAGCDEHPELIEQHRAGQNEAREKGDLQVGEKRFRDTRENQFAALGHDAHERVDQDIEQLLAEPVTEGETGRHGDGAFDQPGAQFLQVLGEGESFILAQHRANVFRPIWVYRAGGPARPPAGQ